VIFAKELQERSGAYLEDCQVFESSEDWVNNPENPEKLWKLSEKLVGQRYDIMRLGVRQKVIADTCARNIS
jgi:hypothetical protein